MAELFIVPNPDQAQVAADVLPPDRQAREQALDVKQSWIVEAPAGSGKTGLLMQRYLKLLADESVQQPEQVLAITFTVKATAEMRDRIVHQLQLASGPDQSKTSFEREARAQAQAVMARDKMLGWALLDHPRKLNIRTIDSICGEIAHSLPVLSGGGGALSPIVDASALHREAARRTLMQLGGTDAELSAALRTLLLHRDGSLKNSERLLAEVLALRDQWGELVPLSRVELDDAYLDGTIRPQLQRALALAIEAGLARLAELFPSEPLDELASLAGEMGSSPGYNGQPSPIEHCENIFTAPQATVEDLEHWRALIHLLITKDSWRKSTSKNHLLFEIEKPYERRLKQIQNRLRNDNELFAALKHAAALPPPQYPEDQWVVAKALFRTLSRALAELQIVFAERGECDFTELGLLARAALNHDGSSGNLAEALGMKIQHLLVDEVQDTSTSQYNLIELLTQGWDGCSQTVFLVGDPKQSIYLFRQARVERFVRTMLTGELGELTLGRLQLTANFRSQAGLVNAFNGNFSLLFPVDVSNTTPEDVPYVEATAVRSATSGARNAVWHNTVLPYAPRSNQEAVKRAQVILDAQSARSIIEQWRARPIPPGRTMPWKIAVLVRSRNLLGNIIAELKAATIPYRAVDIEVLGERQEVLDLFALTRALLHPADRTAWLAVLRAPWCGLGLAELHTLSGADNPDLAKRSIENVIAERGDLLSEESCERLTRVWPVMRAAAAKRPLLTTAQLVERTWRSLGGDAYLSSDETRNAQRYLQLLDELEEETGAIDLILLQRRMENLFANAHPSEDAVDLVTIHGAKGLEWDVVIVPSLEKTPKQNKSRLLTWEEFDSSDSDAANVVLAPIEGRGEASKALNTWLRSIHAEREASEQKRLFYVACTRAKEELHLFATLMVNAKGELKPPAGSLLNAAWPAAERHLIEQPPAHAGMPETAAGLEHAEEHSFLDLAASADTTNRHPHLNRLPLAFHPQKRFTTAPALFTGGSTPEKVFEFARPEGSLEARAFGNTVHAYLEKLAKRATLGETPDALLAEVATWRPRIIALLRSDGLPQNLLERYSEQVMTALANTLRDEKGRWVLTTQNSSSTELPMTEWQHYRISVRMDRIFRAGSEPMSEGDSCIWIVDYKTSTHGAEGIDAFLREERAKYAAQLESYARIVAESESTADIRVGLYFPMLPDMVWWKPQTES